MATPAAAVCFKLAAYNARHELFPRPSLSATAVAMKRPVLELRSWLQSHGINPEGFELVLVAPNDAPRRHNDRLFRA
jgi:hypothetical protein